MIPKECKRLAEVDFPISGVGEYALAEKARRTGTPHQLHHWWAWRPLASTRAMMMALLLPDPCDNHCPEKFKDAARKTLLNMQGRPQGWTDIIVSDKGLRQVFLKFITDFSDLHRAVDPTYLDISRTLVKAAHGDKPPLVVDPFAGGGSIPLEAVRVGCEVFASDLNPVACFIMNAKLHGIQKYGWQIVEDLRHAGETLVAEVRKKLDHIYPLDPDGAMPIAYLWARTVRCEAPRCGAEIPLLRSRWLCRKSKGKRLFALKEKIRKTGVGTPYVEFQIFEPRDKNEVSPGTVSDATATCLCCQSVLPPKRVRAQIADLRGGSEVIFDEEGKRIGGARMITVVTVRPGQTGRYYRLPTDADYEVIRVAQTQCMNLLKRWEQSNKHGLSPIPDEPLPPAGTLGFRVQRYGMNTWGDLFTVRQSVLFLTLTSLISEKLESGLVSADCASLLAMVCSKLTDRCNSLVNWSVGVECPNQLFKGNALPMGWDFAESNALSSASGSIVATIKAMTRNAASTIIPGSSASVPSLADATKSALLDESAHIWFTDPPYYSAIPYADLSDFFLVWLKRALPGHPLLYDHFDTENPLSPKDGEAVQDKSKSVDGCVKNGAWFENTMAKAFTEGRRVLREDGVSCIVFAHSTTEGWEAFLSGMIRGGLVVTASWPIATERAARMRARNSAALATSVHLVCRPRPEDAPVGDWADVLHELPRRVGDWMERLQGEGIRGADLVFACIGPALEIYSRYRTVETAEGSAVALADYLEKVWEVVGRTALRQILGTEEAGTLEEDARLTALFLWALQDTETVQENNDKEEDDEAVEKIAAKGFSLPFDVVRRFAQPMGIDLGVWADRIIGQDKGVVRLLPVAERARDLFGEDGARAAADWIESDPGAAAQMTLFPDFNPAPNLRGRRPGKRNILDGDAELKTIDATTLDRVHAAMLLQASGHANALRTLIGAEQDRGPEFLRLANALSALYPRGSREKRLLDAMLLATPR